MSKQDGAYARTAADLERKYNFGRTFAEVYGLVSDAQKAADEAKAAFDNLDHDEIFNLLTNYGEYQGIYRADGNVYINAEYIKSGYLSADRIKGESITASKIAANAITTEKIDTGAITTLKIASGAVTATEIKASTITGDKIAAYAITADHIATGTITADQIASSTITGDKIAAGAINANHISAGAITANHLAAGAITADKITSGTFTGSNLTLSGLLTIQSRGYIGGGIGGANGSRTYGAVLTDLTESNGVLATTAGAKLFSSGYEISVHASGVTSYGSFWPGASGTYRLGSSSFRWSEVYADTSEIVTSDRDKKHGISYDLTKYERMFVRLMPAVYKFNNGTSNRWHMGFISQDVEDGLEDSELTSLDFAGFIKSPRLDENGEVVEGEYDYALRYEEFIALNTYMIQKLMNRVSALEEKLV